MEKKNKPDLRISGSASAPGGSYNNVVISGQGDINGDLDCVELRISGASDILGNVKTKTGKILGKATINGDLKSDEFKVSGMLEVRGDVDVKEMRIEGSALVKNNLSADYLEIKGGVKVKKDCSAESFLSKGAFAVDGLLSADTIDIVLYGPCRAKEIGGEKITVRKGEAFRIANFIRSILASLDLNDGLSVDLIEGDDIHLENTKAKVVRGNNVIIGQECEIGLVEYKTKFEQSASAQVKEKKKVR